MTVTPTDPAAPSVFVGTFGTTVDDVLALCPEAKVYDNEAAIPPDRRGITRDDVARWIADCDGVVSVAVAGWQAAPNTIGTVTVPVDATDGVTAVTGEPGLYTTTATTLTTTTALTVNGVPVTPGTDLDTLTRAARAIVTVRAAAYLEGARFPERTGPATTSYEAVLWQRWQLGLEQLTAWWAGRRRALGLDTGTATGGVAGTASAVFPAATYTDGWSL